MGCCGTEVLDQKLDVGAAGAPRTRGPMSQFLRLTRVRIGLVLLIVGTGPLLAIIAAAKLGLTDDPNPNPVIFGILAFFTFWPSIALVLSGVAHVRQERQRPTGDPAGD